MKLQKLLPRIILAMASLQNTCIGIYVVHPVLHVRVM